MARKENTTRFFKSFYASGKSRTDIAMPGQSVLKQAEHIAGLHGEKLERTKVVSKPKYIRKHEKKFGF